MRVIGVTSRRRRGYVAARRGYIAPFRGYVAHHVCNPLSQLVFFARFCLLPFFYLLPTGRPLWTSREPDVQRFSEGGLHGAMVISRRFADLDGLPAVKTHQATALCGQDSPGAPTSAEVAVTRIPTCRLRRYRHVSAMSVERAPASGGRNGASRLDGPLAGRVCAQPDRPSGPPLSPRLRRGSSCGSIRARGARNEPGRSPTVLACREGACGRTVIVARASPIGARQAEGKASRGAGGRLRNAGQRAGAVHILAVWAAQPSMGGRVNRDSRRATLVLGLLTSPSKPNGGGHDSSELFAPERKSVLISNVPKSCRSLVRAACRTRGGLAVFGCNSDMRRHGEL